jgi:predicted oxidoreductase
METELSRIIQGCMTWGIWGKNFSTQDIVNRIEQNIDLGVTTFDHADIYGDYSTEASFGKAFKESSIPRQRIQLISKCGIQLINEQRQTSVKHYNYDKEYIINQAVKSLDNLKTDYLDLFLLHRPSPLMQVDEIAEAITKLKNSGKIKSFGVSNFTPQQIDFLSQALEVEANQIQCSLTHFQPIEDDTLFYHQQNKIVSMAWSPLGDIFSEDKSFILQNAVEDLTAKYNCSQSQIALAWLLKHPAKIHPVLGTSKTERIQEAMEAVDIDLQLQDWYKLYQSTREKEVN